jgi:hypothetical protein
MTTPDTTAPHINQLRKHLMDSLADLRNRDNPMEPDRARAIAQVASVLVDTAKIEIDYLKATGQGHASFLEQPADPSVAALGSMPGSGYSGGTVERIGNVTRHRMGG